MRLKELREERNLTQMDVAKSIQTSQSNIGRWEKGLNEPAASYLIKLANLFNVSSDYLLGISDDFGVISVKEEKDALSEEERALIQTYRKLNIKNRMHVAAYAQVRLEEQERVIFKKGS